MNKKKTFLVLISLFFLIVEIWEPSTDFVRATIKDPGSALILNGPIMHHSESLKGPTLINVDSDLNFNCSHGEDVSISHSSDGFFIFDLSPSTLILTIQPPRPQIRLDGYFTVRKIPPIHA